MERVKNDFQGFKTAIVWGPNLEVRCSEALFGSVLIMAARVADVDIILSSCGFFYLFFLGYSQPSYTGCLPYMYLHTWCGLSVNLEYRSETCCTQLAENTECKKSPKIRHLGLITQLCPALSSQLGMYRQSEKNLLSSDISSTSPHNMVNVGPQRLRYVRELRAPQQISTGFACWPRYCTNVAQRRSTKLCTMFRRLQGCYTIYTFPRALAPNGIFFTCKKNSLYVQVLRSLILAALLHGTPAAGVSQTLRRWAEDATYIWQGSHHTGHRPTFYWFSLRRFNV